MSAEIVKAYTTELFEAELIPAESAALQPSPPSTNAMMDAFEWFIRIEIANGDATDDTIVAYRREVEAWVLWCERNQIEPLAATRDHVELYRFNLKTQKMAASTRSFKLSIVRRFYAAAIRHGLLQTNPAEGVRAGKDLTAAEDKLKVLAQPELVELFESIVGDTIAAARDKAILGLMALHGLRRIEVHRLSHEDLHDADTESPYLQVEGKGSKTRRVYLRTDTLSALVTYSHAKMNAGLPLKGALFVAHGNRSMGKQLSRQALNEIADKYLEATGIKREGVSCHALRHTFGTLAIAGGAKVEHLREAMGHSNIETTNIYVRAVNRAKNNPANFIDVEL
jgi:site-specific recombinase XerD